jgi:hypothetical protein
MDKKEGTSTLISHLNLCSRCERETHILASHYFFNYHIIVVLGVPCEIYKSSFWTQCLTLAKQVLYMLLKLELLCQP